MRRGPRWSRSERGPLAHAAGASVVPSRKSPPRPSGGSLCDAKAKEAPSPLQWGSRWSQSEGGPLAHEVGGSAIQSEGGSDAHAARASVVSKRKRPSHPCGTRLSGPKAKEAPTPMRQGPR